jgi:hypothetical protein
MLQEAGVGKPEVPKEEVMRVLMAGTGQQKLMEFAGKAMTLRKELMGGGR